MIIFFYDFSRPYNIPSIPHGSLRSWLNQASTFFKLTFYFLASDAVSLPLICGSRSHVAVRTPISVGVSESGFHKKRIIISQYVTEDSMKKKLFCLNSFSTICFSQNKKSFELFSYVLEHSKHPMEIKVCRW